MAEKNQKCVGVVVTVGPKSGYGYDKKKDRWYCCYKNRGKLERRYVEAANAEEAIVARDEIFTAMLMQGAVRKGGQEQKGPKKRVLREKTDINFGITEFEIRVKRYRVIVGGIDRGIRSTLGAARKIRDKWVKITEWRPCDTCGVRPSYCRDKNLHGILKHDQPGCTNQLLIRRIGQEDARLRWNKTLSRQTFEI